MTRNLVQLSDNIWLWPHNPDPAAVQASVGIITHGDECMLVDAGNGPALARQIKASLEEQGLPPVTRIVYTHHHWDHVYGACAFEAPAVAHAECRAILEQEALKQDLADLSKAGVMSQGVQGFEGQRRAVRDALAKTDLDTIYSHISFNKEHYSVSPLVGIQWVKGKKWKWELEIVYNKENPFIPKTADMIFPLPKQP